MKVCTNTKDMTLQRYAKGRAGATMTVAANITTIMKFLTMQKYKQQFIFMLSTELEKSNYKTYHAHRDANLLVVQKAVRSATTSKTVLVGEDTNLIVLLCYHASLDSHDFFFCSEPKKNIKKFHVWNIRATKEKLGQGIYSNILFIHAILGCDTTSHHIFLGLERDIS